MRIQYSRQLKGQISDEDIANLSNGIKYWYQQSKDRIKLPDDITIKVLRSPYALTATGMGGYTRSKDVIELKLSPNLMELALSTGLPTAVAHESHHLARGFHGDTWSGSAMEAAVAEGLASIFEYEVTSIMTPMSQYNAAVKGWVPELQSLGENWSYNEWFLRPNKGRWYLGYKVGRFIVDQALKNNPSQTAASLVCEDYRSVLHLAGFR